MSSKGVSSSKDVIEELKIAHQMGKILANFVSNMYVVSKKLICLQNIKKLS